MKLVAFLTMAIVLTSCNNPSFGDRKAALDYVKKYDGGKPEKPMLHSVSYYKEWCEEGDSVYWPQVVSFCKEKDREINTSTDICLSVILVEEARIKNRVGCDPS
ncbi:hypothetical protein [Aeromonas salmonicida]|uniref:hypothetical protein n=1 Tax=Aeromonas salmonicida TaxID=645 RepID=UPI0038B73A4B